MYYVVKTTSLRFWCIPKVRIDLYFLRLITVRCKLMCIQNVYQNLKHFIFPNFLKIFQEIIKILLVLKGSP